ncbi:MAG: tRNA lysidine(34) synthetase TilS [Clostridia bacterium]|nr:tRNA lysidine(34) synthetase TilS [Clostridia bacterium]
MEVNFLTENLPEGFSDPEALSGFSKNTPILVGYSGGADSTALLHMLWQYGKRHGTPVYAAHIHHGIRGKEADRDEEFCHQFAEQLGIPLFVYHADVPRLAKERGESVETTARHVRYHYFDSLMEEHGIPLLATAHNACDNLETMLFHLVRGSGLGGMCGIPQSRLCPHGTLIRPILGMTRDEILAYCQLHGLSFVEDSTNTDTDYTRNKIRSGILPLLLQINSSAVENSVRVADTLREDHLCLESMANMFLEEMRRGYGLETEKVSGAPAAIAHRALRKLYEEISQGCSLSYAHVTSLRQLAKKGIPHSALTLPGGIDAVVEDGYLEFRPHTKREDLPAYFLPLSEEKNLLSQINCEIVMGCSQKRKNIYKNSILLSIDSDTINGMLVARNRLPGDRILAGGMHKSVKKLLCDKKIPLSLRARLPVLCDNDGIVVIPGVAQRDGSKPKDPDASGALHLSIYFYE